MPEEDLPGGSFEGCVAEMQDRGNDADAAERICGALLEETKSENGNLDELQSAIERGQGLIADVGVDLNSAVDVPAIDSQWVAMKDADSEYNVRRNAEVVLKQDGDDEKRISYAPAMIPRELDKEGDVVGTATVENAAHEYLASEGGVDTDHSLIDGKGEVVESWIEPEARAWDVPNGETKEYPAGTWMLGIKWDAEPWSRIKAGELTGLSIYGQAEKVALGKSLDKGFEVPFADEAVVHVVYESRTAAAKAAEEMGFEGDPEEITHTHEFDDIGAWMPGPDHAAYVEAYMELAESGDDAGDGEAVESDATATNAGDSDTEDGETDNTAQEKADKQNNTMTDDPTDDGGDDAPDVEALKSDVESLTETVSTLKEALDAEKDESQPDSASGQMDKIVQEIQAYEEVDLSASEIRDQIKELVAQSKEDDMDGGEDEGEDEEKAADDGGETEKSTEDTNVAKAANAANAGAATTATAKDADGGAKSASEVLNRGNAVDRYEGGTQ